MAEVELLSDRDILIRIDTKLEALEPRISALEVGLADTNKRITALELDSVRSKGFFDGAKAMWGFILSLPVGLIGLLVGKGV